MVGDMKAIRSTRERRMVVAVLLLVSVLLAAGCGKQESAGSKINRMIDKQQVARGGKLFAANCARCHGANAEGAPNWRKRGPDGKYPAPPLNGTGHAWHHSEKVLIYTILNGTINMGGSMPAWKSKLSVQDARDIIAWFQAKWPDDIYMAWMNRNL